MIEIGSPLSGWAMPLDKVPDPVFSERMLGEGMAIDPVAGLLLAPAAGTVRSIHSSGHAITLELDEGPVLLVHVGIDTVALGGAGFLAAVREGDRVEAGDRLIEFDLDLVARRAPSLATPVIVTNGDAFRIASFACEGPIAPGDMLLTLEPVGGAKPSQGTSPATTSRPLRLLLAHGLHARPAARLSKLAGEFDAKVEIVAGDGRLASARSPVAMLGLGLRHGAEFVIQGGGPEAEKAVAALAELLEGGMGELQPVAATVPDAPTKIPGKFLGTAAVPGLAIGPAWRFEEPPVAFSESAADPGEECRALTDARARVEEALKVEAQGRGPSAAIASAHLAMVADPELDGAAQRLIASGKSAAFAWAEAMRIFAEPLKSSNDPRFAERLDDLRDLERRVLAELAGAPAETGQRPPEGSILLAPNLYPSQLKSVSGYAIAGIATAAGGATSHAAIIAAALGLPMIVGLGEGILEIDEGTMLILRGGLLELAGDDEVLARARAEADDRRAFREAARARSSEPSRTADGARVEVFANLGSVADATLAVDEGAEGCGLLRTEFLFLDRDVPPGEEEQRDAYQRIADVLGERPLIVRTLDIGADKPAPWLPLAPEDNPALGLRGIRLQLARRDLLETQLRALLGVRSSLRLRIMLPMVSSLAEIRETRAILASLARDMGAEEPDLGIMIETPAAALMAAMLAAEADFFSVGTNDLSQYVLARDRTNPAVAGLLDGLEPPVLRLIAETAAGASSKGRITGVCGGLAAMPEAIPILLGLGVTELSVPCAAIAETKALVRNLRLEDCRRLAAEAIAAPDAEAVRTAVLPLLEDLQ
jgi:phosphocarrier protein FPr/phosphocarrier protein